MKYAIAALGLFASVLLTTGCSGGAKEACAASYSGGSSAGRSSFSGSSVGRSSYSGSSSAKGSSGTSSRSSSSGSKSSTSSKSSGASSFNKSYTTNRISSYDSGHPYLYGGLWYAFPWWLYWTESGKRKCGSPTPPASPPPPSAVPTGAAK